MGFRKGFSVVVTLVVAASLASVTGCEDEDDCERCCQCQNDNDPFVYDTSSGECASCEEQCQALADREFMGQEFDIVERVECDE
jgi:hypothetical protein